ncbi:uncharacterized protein [Haliotis cracherodii]|uniref:uncharacterized protein n=1 Tax=Haliotis cracherodii TaxID=6455 RepID=UPI0039ECDDE7
MTAPTVTSYNPQYLHRPHWCRLHTCCLLKVTMDGPKPTNKTMVVIIDEGQMATRRVSTLTPWYWLEDTHPGMVSATLKDLASQHMKYFRASPSRATGQQAGRSQIQIMEDLYWEELRKWSVHSGTHDKSSNSFTDDAISMRNVHMCLMANLNKNNNGNTKEDQKSSLTGPRSQQGISKCQERAKPKSIHGYSSKRPTNSVKLRVREQTHHGDPATNNTNHSKSVANKAWNDGLSNRTTMTRNQDGNMTLRHHVVDWKNHHEQTQGNRTVVAREACVGGAEDVVTTSLSDAADASMQTDLSKNDAQSLERLLWEVSHFNSISDIPKTLKDTILQTMCKPLLNGGYREEKTLWSNLFNTPVLPGSTKQSGVLAPHTAATTSMNQPEEGRESLTDMKQCNRMSERSICRQDNRPCRTRTSLNSLWDDFFSLEDDILDIPTLSILSPPRTSLGQAFHNDHDVSPLSTLDHDEDKPASHEPFPSEYVFKRVCGPSFSMSSEFWHIKIPTLPSHMVDYKVEQDGLTDKVIGTGCCGQVYAATLTVSPGLSRDIVVKEIFVNMRSMENIVNETRITLYLGPTGCVPICYGLVKDVVGRHNIVLELFGSGQTLRDIINKKKTLSKQHWLHIACQLVDGLRRIHDKDVIINDIKPDNILVDLSGTLPTVKYCDMGSASYKSGVTYDESQDMKNFTYIAPEVCAHAETTKDSDVFSLGKVFQNIHTCSQISTMWGLYKMCSAETPDDRPTLSCLRLLLQEQYTEVLSQTLTVAPHGDLHPSDEEPEHASFVTKDSESAGKKGSPRDGSVKWGNEASKDESQIGDESAATDNDAQGSLPSTIRNVTNIESAVQNRPTVANIGVSTSHELYSHIHMSDIEAEFSTILQSYVGTKDDSSLLFTHNTAAATEHQTIPASAMKTEDTELTRHKSFFVREDHSMSSPIATEDHSMSSPIATEDHGMSSPIATEDHGLSSPVATVDHGRSPPTTDLAAPLLSDRWFTSELKGPLVPEGPGPAPASQVAPYPSLIHDDVTVFDGPRKKGSPRDGSVKWGNEASKDESQIGDESAATDNDAQGSLPSTRRNVTNIESAVQNRPTVANIGVSTSHELYSHIHMADTEAEFSTILQSYVGTKDDSSLLFTHNTAAATEHQTIPASAMKTEDTELTRHKSFFVREHHSMSSPIATEDHGRSSPIATEDHGLSSPVATEDHGRSPPTTDLTAPLLSDRWFTSELKGPLVPEGPGPAAASASQVAPYPSLIQDDVTVFDEPSEFRFSDVVYFPGLLLILALSLLWPTSVDVG